MDDRGTLIDAFERVRERLLLETDAVPPDLRQTPFVGHWHLMDVIAHLVGWDYTNLQAIEALQAGATPEFYTHYDPGWAAYNQELIERYGTADWHALRDAIARSQSAVLAKLRSLSAEDLTKPHSDPARRRPITLAGILRAAIRDEQEHLQQLRTFIRAHN